MKEVIINNNPPTANCAEDYIFISYSHKDRAVVYSDLWKIHEQGFSFWYDEGITAGEVWNQTVEQKITCPNCKLAIFFVSENTIISSAIRKEMELVKQNGKPFFTVNISDSDIPDMVASAIQQKTLRFSEMGLFMEFFHEDIIYLKRSDPEYRENIAKQCMRYGLVANVEVLTVKNAFKKVLIICKNSSFSNSIINGITDFLSKKENVTVDKKLIDKNLNRLDCAVEFSHVLSENINEYDGFILRVPEKYNEQLLQSIREILAKGKKVLLLDIELSPDKTVDMPCAPSFVGSDFVSGGALLGERIGDLTNKFGVKESAVVLFEGPYLASSAKTRCESLNAKLSAVSPNAKVLKYNLPSLSAQTALSYIKTQAQEWERNRTFAYKTVILFCGIDNIAVEVMRTLTRNEEYDPINKALKMAKKVVIVGYDGIRDASNEVILKNYGIDFLTIDVVPFKQGVDAGQKIYSMLFNNQSNSTILTKPELVENIKFNTEKFSKAKDIQFLLANKKALIFDLDGTIADTEVLHWEAYAELLSQMGAQLTDEHIKRYIGNAETAIYQMIKNDFSIDFDEEDFMERRINIYLDLVKKRNLQPHDFIYDILKGSPAKKGLITSQIPLVVNKLLTLWGLDEYFPQNCRFCCHNGVYTKKDIYKNISYYMGFEQQIAPGSVVLFEDSMHYLAEAQKLGFVTVGVEHKFNKNCLKNCDAVMAPSLSRGVFVGLCGLDNVYYSNNPLPEENTKIKITEYNMAIGGPAANAAITYAKLGGDAYLVTAIGNSEEGVLIKSKLKALNVEVVDLADNKKLKTNVSFIYVNLLNGSRTIFSGQASRTGTVTGDFEEVVKRADFVLYDGNLPQAESKMIEYVEHYDKDLILDAGSFKAGFPECFYRAKTVIASADFKFPSGEDIFQLQRDYGFKYAAKTAGKEDIIYSDGTERKTIPTLKVNAVDTLGAGDIIHGAFGYFAYLKKYPFEKALECASQIASLSVTQKGVVCGIEYAIKAFNLNNKK